MRKQKQSQKFMGVAAVLIASFGFLALFGLPLSMTTDEHGQMSNCPFMSQVEVICPMQVGEHITKWQQAVTGIPQRSMGIAFAALLAFVSWHFIGQFLLQGSTAIASAFQRLRRERRLHSLFNFLQLAFSQGILHPKIW